MTVLRYMTDYMTDPHRHDGRRDSLGPNAPAREQIPNRIKDTADFIVKLQSHRFQADCWLVSADVVEFYPNTKEANGESVIKQFIPSELTDICLKHYNSTLVKTG